MQIGSPFIRDHPGELQCISLQRPPETWQRSNKIPGEPPPRSQKANVVRRSRVFAKAPTPANEFHPLCPRGMVHAKPTSKKLIRNLPLGKLDICATSSVAAAWPPSIHLRTESSDSNIVAWRFLRRRAVIRSHMTKMTSPVA
jgi:hypothetical protein